MQASFVSAIKADAAPTVSPETRKIPAIMFMADISPYLSAICDDSAQPVGGVIRFCALPWGADTRCGALAIRFYVPIMFLNWEGDLTKNDLIRHLERLVSEPSRARREALLRKLQGEPALPLLVEILGSEYVELVGQQEQSHSEKTLT
jgi:hypothetical protein